MSSKSEIITSIILSIIGLFIIVVPSALAYNKYISDKTLSPKKKIRRTIELTIGDIVCFVKPHSDFVCDTIVRGILPKRHNGLESPTVYV